MREILFRGKQIDDGEWVEGCCIKGNNECNFCEICDINDFTLHCVLVDSETTGQYIGLTDKNSRKIFEGDILKVHDNWEREDFVGVVDFDNASFMITDGFVSHYRWMDYECEVIGNLYDNPELLEGKNEK